LEESRFHTLQAGQFPAGLDHAADEKDFRLVGGLEGLGVGIVQVLEGLAVFMGEHGEAGAQSVGSGIAAGSSFSRGRQRPGAALGVMLVGEDLRVGTHCDLRVADEEEKTARAFLQIGCKPMSTMVERFSKKVVNCHFEKTSSASPIASLKSVSTMRSILIDMARRRKRIRRGGDPLQIALDESHLSAG
jgi:hypothetical protein